MNTEQLLSELSLLQAARLLLDDKSHWCQHVCAQKITGESTLTRDPHATSWCSLGALGAFDTLSHEHWRQCCIRLHKELAAAYTSCVLTTFNDSPTTTHTQVLEMFDKAIMATCLEIDGPQH